MMECDQSVTLVRCCTNRMQWVAAVLIDMREHDMPLHVRVSIFMGSWYDVMCKGSNEQPTITKREDLI